MTSTRRSNLMRRHAEISKCGKYRYLLERAWGRPLIYAAILVVCMLNPSIADALIDDATIRWLIGYAKKLGPENMVNMAPESWRDGWPRNVWAMCSVEDQKRADERIPHLLRVPAVVRGLSCEPLLGPIQLSRDTEGIWPRIDWVIAGGESGGHARPMHPSWVRGIRDQCVASGVAFHFKQWGEWRLEHDLHEFAKRVGKKAAGRELDGRTWDEFPVVGSSA